MNFWRVLTSILLFLVILLLISLLIVEINSDGPFDFCENLNGWYEGSSKTLSNNIVYLECCKIIKQIDGSYKKECKFYKWRKE